MLRILMISLAALSLAACQAKTSATADGQAQAQGPVAGDQSKEASGPATGLKPHLQDEVKVNYEGKLIDGTVFDSSYERGQPYAAPLNNLVKGWQEALQLMRPGDVWMLYVPPELGYGADGQGKIPPGAALIFKIELIDSLPGPGTVQRG
jgi:peptidylprolyl isomerase/FKBP-type peptidyl-prolyl cis-trans isomerase FklB